MRKPAGVRVRRHVAGGQCGGCRAGEVVPVQAVPARGSACGRGRREYEPVAGEWHLLPVSPGRSAAHWGQCVCRVHEPAVRVLEGQEREGACTGEASTAGPARGAVCGWGRGQGAGSGSHDVQRGAGSGIAQGLSEARGDRAWCGRVCDAAGGAAVKRDVSTHSLFEDGEVGAHSHSEDLKGDGGDRSENLSVGFVSGRSHPRPRASVRAPEAAPVSDAAAADAWRLEPHVCRACFSRLVSRPDAGGRRYHCTNCGLEALGAGPEVLCSCGLKIRRPLKGAGSGHTLVDAGVRCMANPAPTPEFPSLFVAGEPPP